MSNLLQQELVDTLNYLISLNQESIRPEEAKSRIRQLQKQYPDLDMELLWEEESYDYSLHYDVLLRLKDKGTVSLSFCPDKALPWPMRGIHRWREADLVRVNNITLTIEQGIVYLDFIWEDKAILNRLINTCLLQEALDKDPIELSDDELQEAMNTFRKTHKLYKTDDTYRWMEQHGMNHEQFERYVADGAIVAKLQDKIVTKAHIEEYFTNHQADLDTVHIAQLKFSSAEEANKTYEQISTGAKDFYVAAQQGFLTTKHQEPNNIFAILQRGKVESKLRKSIFAAKANDILEPVKIDKDYIVIRVLSYTPACLDERTYKIIGNLLFEEWLAEKRQAAIIEWYWGNADQISQTLLG